MIRTPKPSGPSPAASSPEAAEFLEMLPYRWSRSLIWAFAIILTALTAWAYWCRVDQTVAGRGVLVCGPPPTWVQAPARGPLQALWVHSGDLVAQGVHLFEVGGETVNAPHAGYVTAVRVAPGASLEAGDVVLGLAPSEGPYVFEAMVANQDISRVRVGQEARVHLDAYPLESFGALPAWVQSIQPVYETTDHPYRITFQLGRQSIVGRQQQVYPLLPALTGEVEMVVGEQSLLDLILRPL